MRPTEVQNKQNWREHRCEGSNPHRGAHNIKVMKQSRAERDYR